MFKLTLISEWAGGLKKTRRGSWDVEEVVRESPLNRKSGGASKSGQKTIFPLDDRKESDSGSCNTTLSTILPHFLLSSD